MKKDFLSVHDLSRYEFHELLDLAADIKKDREKYRKALKNQVLAMIFEKPSLRTRMTFEVGMLELGGTAIYLSPNEIQLGKRETVEDVAHNLERWVDGIMIRTFAHDNVVRLAAASRVPVINALTDLSHPCQAMADFLTLREHKGGLSGLKLAWSGDGNNVAHSLMLAAAKAGHEDGRGLPQGLRARSRDRPAGPARTAGTPDSSSYLTNDPREAVKGADAIYADVWTSMGQEAEKEERLKTFAPLPGQPRADGPGQARRPSSCTACPAHREEEVTASVIDSPRSIVFDQAENRLHAQKAIMLTLMGKNQRTWIRTTRSSRSSPDDIAFVEEELAKSPRPFTLRELTEKLAFLKTAGERTEVVKIYDPGSVYGVGDSIYKEYDELLTVGSKVARALPGRGRPEGRPERSLRQDPQLRDAGSRLHRRRRLPQVRRLHEEDQDRRPPAVQPGHGRHAPDGHGRREDPRLTELPDAGPRPQGPGTQLRAGHGPSRRPSSAGATAGSSRPSSPRSPRPRSRRSRPTWPKPGCRPRRTTWSASSSAWSRPATCSRSTACGSPTSWRRSTRRNSSSVSPVEWGKWHLKSVLNAMPDGLPLSASEAPLPEFDPNEKVDITPFHEFPLKVYLGWREIHSGGVKIPKTYNKELAHSREYVFTDADENKSYIVYYFPQNGYFLGLREFLRRGQHPPGHQHDPGEGRPGAVQLLDQEIEEEDPGGQGHLRRGGRHVRRRRRRGHAVHAQQDHLHRARPDGQAHGPLPRARGQGPARAAHHGLQDLRRPFRGLGPPLPAGLPSGRRPQADDPGGSRADPAQHAGLREVRQEEGRLLLPRSPGHRRAGHRGSPGRHGAARRSS